MGVENADGSIELVEFYVMKEQASIFVDHLHSSVCRVPQS